MNKNTCIRVLADPVQIRECKENLAALDDPISKSANIFNLSGNEVRLKILYLLQKENEMCPCDLSDVLDMTVPSISQHLRKLKDGGIIKNKKIGQTIFYSLIEENMELIKPVLDNLLSQPKKELVNEFI